MRVHRPLASREEDPFVPADESAVKEPSSLRKPRSSQAMAAAAGWRRSPWWLVGTPHGSSWDWRRSWRPEGRGSGPRRRTKTYEASGIPQIFVPRTGLIPAPDAKGCHGDTRMILRGASPVAEATGPETVIALAGLNGGEPTPRIGRVRGIAGRVFRT